MTLVNLESGCKVGWEVYDNEAEAIEASKRALADGISKANRGYDFGYQQPGEIRHVEHYVSRHRHDREPGDEYDGEAWIVTIP